ncbi:MAG: NmrA family NAD(P)-binding protein [Alphaproteobacteria bacterium]|nr:NmrA family NAD(P)-binding protein [Alphaproteobacteria bacterium]MBU1560831.1 NmrA family NAD(P)-binding protein [Alphaproteobacteria bacterium]MBU2304805.1 NmrA family NAD(P)-binding protein [Alphaproteobacteria bacterium]MBU2370101.1 NmrA family NAD(P)-binding protein [Alphaproteobacteria bacterium]
MSSTSPILVIGATAKVGARIAAKLGDLGHAVRAVSRRTSPAFDWEDPSGWAPALAGTEVAYVSYVPDLAAEGAPEIITRFIETARTAGVRKLVLLSGRGEHGAVRCENIVRNSGLDFTLVRASWFNQNFSEGHLHPQVMGGTIALPAGMRREPFIDVDDIADVAVAALLDARHNGELYEVTGPRLLSFADAAAELAAVTGQPVQYVPITGAVFHAALLPEVGPFYADLLTNLCAEVFDGRNESLGDGVQRALDRQPLDFADFCRKAATAGAWRQAA